MAKRIKSTRHRHPTLVLSAEHEDAGPYYLTTIDGYGVKWTKKRFGSPHPWIESFQKALLAFELVELDESLTPKEAKSAADRTIDWYAGWRGQSASHATIVSHAFDLVEKARRR